MVGGETEKIKNRKEIKVERKLILWVFSWREGEDEKLVGLKCFLSCPTKIVSLQFGKKIEKREIVVVNDYMSLFI